MALTRPSKLISSDISGSFNKSAVSASFAQSSAVTASLRSHVLTSALSGSTTIISGSVKSTGSFGSIYVDKNVNASAFVGDGSALSGIDIPTAAAISGSIVGGVSGSVASTGSFGSIYTDKNVNASAFVGDGSSLTGIDIPTAAAISGSIVGGVSGSIVSTGSFGRVEAAGDVELKAGNLIIGTHGKGIDFSATSDASGTGVSMGSELLDDYEEGTWTPKFGGTTSNPTQNYANQQGRYTRTGNIVVCTGEVKLATSGISAGSGEPEIEQLPFTAKSGLTEYYGACAISGVKDWSTSNAGAPDRGTVEGNTTAVRLRIVNAGQAGHTDASAADYTNSTRILGFLVVYEVD